MTDREDMQVRRKKHQGPGGRSISIDCQTIIRHIQEAPKNSATPISITYHWINPPMMMIIITESTSILRLAHKILQPTPTAIVEILCTINFSAQILSRERSSPTSIFPRQNQRAQSAEKSWQDKMKTYQPVARVAKSGETQVWVWWNHTHRYLIKGPADQLGWICKHNAEHRKYHLTKFKRRDMEKMRSSTPRQRPKGGGMKPFVMV